MYAEAKTELNQIDQSVYDAVNLVRNQAGMPDCSLQIPPFRHMLPWADQEEIVK